MHRTFKWFTAFALVGPYLVIGSLAWVLSDASVAPVQVAGFVIVLFLLGLEAMTLREPQSEGAQTSSGIASGLVVSLVLSMGPIDVFILHWMDIPRTGLVFAFAIALILTLTGSALRLIARRQLGSFFTHALQVVPSQTLIDHGVYGLVRHPAYVGTALFLISSGPLVGSLSTAFAAALALPFGIIRVHIEEKMLSERLDAAGYAEYRTRVGMFLPKIKLGNRKC